MINIDLICEYASEFAKLAQSNSQTISKKYVLDRFFNIFKNRYVILYDTVESQYDQGASDLYGPKMTFSFMNRTADTPKQVINEVTKGIESSPLGPSIHAISITWKSDKIFACNLQFKSSVVELN